MDSTEIAQTIEEQPWLGAAEDVQTAVLQAYESGGEGGQKVKNFLHGTWLGHALHPVLTDVPMGAWTVAAALDAYDAARGCEEYSSGADAAIGIGLIGASVAAVSGLTDWASSGQQAPRVGLLHGLLNVGATVLYTTSWLARRRGDRTTGRVLGLLGYATVMASAYLGGELVSGKGLSVDHAERGGLPGDWTAVLPEAELPESTLKCAAANGIRVLLVRRGGQIFAIGEVCSHLGGPLAEGELVDCSVRCPWHGSRFDLRDGEVIDGPATYPQPKFETRVRDGQIEVRAKAAP
jgi:nitrite reductase/ring-hydroxylating ferredoxin subunit/uncharacterized membrane protein